MSATIATKPKAPRRHMTEAEKTEELEMQARIIALRRGCASFSQISQSLNIPQWKAQQMFSRAMRRVRRQQEGDLAETVALELLRLEDLQMRALLYVTKKDVDAEIFAMMVDRILKIQDSRAKYLRIHDKPKVTLPDQERMIARLALQPHIAGATADEIRKMRDDLLAIASRGTKKPTERETVEVDEVPPDPLDDGIDEVDDGAPRPALDSEPEADGIDQLFGGDGEAPVL